MPFRLRESFVVRWPATGAVVLLARGSYSGNGTAKVEHEAVTVNVRGTLGATTPVLAEVLR